MSRFHDLSEEKIGAKFEKKPVSPPFLVFMPFFFPSLFVVLSTNLTPTS
jgi:hypothetical protein